MTDRAVVQKYSRVRGVYEPIDFPKEIANDISNLGSWTGIRPISALVYAPFVRPDGSICDRPGYDPRSRAYYIPNADFPPLAERISREDAEVALELLSEPFSQFPFQTPAAKSAFIAHILTEAARLAMDTSPGYCYSAGTAGTGKTILSEMPATIVHGVKPAQRPYVRESDEMRKTLFASLLAGDRSIAFDNVPTGYRARSSELCAFLTSSVWKDRKLGVSHVIGVDNFAVVSASGNNITPAGDLGRRLMVIRLDADATPDQLRARQFKIKNLRGYVVARRVKLLMAALTIIRGHQQSGHSGPTALPSFEQWSNMVRDPLLWLGMPDPTETQDAETEDDSSGLDEAFTILGTTFAGKWFMAADIVSAVTGFADTDGKIARALQASACADAMSVQKVGYWLRDGRDKIVSGFKLERHPSKSNATATRYRFRQLESQPVAPDNRDLL